MVENPNSKIHSFMREILSLDLYVFSLSLFVCDRMRVYVVPACSFVYLSFSNSVYVRLSVCLGVESNREKRELSRKNSLTKEEIKISPSLS